MSPPGSGSLGPDRPGPPRPPSSPVFALARAWLVLWSMVVPDTRRDFWLEEWEGELCELWGRAGRAPRRYGGRGGAVARFVAGALPSALWEWKEEWVTDLWQDVRYGVRTLLRAPGFLLVAVVTLALGIGANTTVFSLVNGLLFRHPEQIHEPERLVRIGRGHAVDDRFDNWSLPVYRDFRAQGEWFSGVAGFAGVGSLTLGRGLDAQAVQGQLVSDNYFEVLGVRLAAGRGFLAEEMAAPGGGPVIVLSHDLWQSRFGGSPGVLGRTVAVNGRDLEIVGIAPAGFAGSDVLRAPAEVWIPASMITLALGPTADRLWDSRGSSWFWIFARLEPEIAFQRARAGTEALYSRFDQEHPELAGQGVRVARGIGMTPEDRAEAETLSRLLLAVVALVLLIACANLAGLALARGAGRRGELGVRAALGASRVRIVRQLLTESLIVALAGAVVAVGLTWLVAGWLPASIPYPVSVGFEPDQRVLLFALGVAVSAAILFGLLPALRAARPDVRSVLAGDARSVTGGGTHLRRGLVAIQLGLTFVLLTGTGVLLRSLYTARAVDPGFAADRVAVVDVDAGMRTGFDADAGRRFYRELVEEVSLLPQVEAVGLTAALPVVDFQSNHTPIPMGVDPMAMDRNRPPEPVVLYGTADGGYFEAAGIEVVAGRTFGPDDFVPTDEQVAVINQALGRRFFGSAPDAVGRLLPFQARPDRELPTRVVGVVGNHNNEGLRVDPVAQYWTPFPRDYRGAMSVVARTASDPGALADRIADLVQQVDPGMPVLRASDLRSLVGRTLGDTRTLSVLIAVFGGVALVLAAVGLYGVMAYSVARRTREMGVRVALGATARDVVGLVMLEGVAVALLGLAIGFGLAVAGLRILRGALFGVEPTDPLAFLGGGVVLATVAVIAILVPALKATSVEPVVALKEE